MIPLAIGALSTSHLAMWISQGGLWYSMMELNSNVTKEIASMKVEQIRETAEIKDKIAELQATTSRDIASLRELIVSSKPKRFWVF